MGLCELMQVVLDNELLVWGNTVSVSTRKANIISNDATRTIHVHHGGKA